MATMVYTPTDQLPPPPKFILDEVETAEKAHLEDLMNKCFTIRTFRKHVLPIYYRYKSATGHIMAEAIKTWREGQQKYSDYCMENYNIGNMSFYAPPWERVDNTSLPFEVRYNSYFHKSYFRDIEDYECLEDGTLRPFCYKSPSYKMRDNALAFMKRQLLNFIAYKNGKVPASRIRYATEILGDWHPIRENIIKLRNGGEWVYFGYTPRPFKYRKFWDIMDDWKAMKFKKLSPRGLVNNEIHNLIMERPDLN